MLISAVEDCEYTFAWPTPAACPVKVNVHGDCRVTNPATGETLLSPAAAAGTQGAAGQQGPEAAAPGLCACGLFSGTCLAWCPVALLGA